MGAARGHHPRAAGPDRRARLIALSTASVYPETTANGFELASRLGYDAVEVMVGIDPISQEIDAVRHLSEYHEMPVCAVHAPCLLITQRVWGIEPWGKLEKSAEMAAAVGADVVVVHPPFRWQRDYARRFVEGIAELEERTGVAFAVENMYPWRASRREMEVYLPGWDPSRAGLRQRHHRPVALGGLPLRPGGDGRAARRPAAAHPHDRRHRLGQGRAPGARAAAPSRWSSSSSTSPASTSSGHIVAGDQHPQGGGPGGPRARPAGGARLHPAELRRRARDPDDRGARVAGAAVRVARTPAARSSPRPGSPSRTRASPARRSGRVAAEAGVDPALVHHYFGAKDDLFLAALEIPVDPRTAGAGGLRRGRRRRPGSGCSGCSCRCGTTRTPGSR